MKSVLCVIGPGKKTETMLVRAFYSGCVRHGIRSDVQNYASAVHAIDEYDAIAIAGARKASTVFMYRRCVETGKPYYYIDNGYFMSRWHTETKDAYFRITKNAMQHSGIGNSDPARFATLGLEVEEWKTPRKDERIVVALQSEWWYELHGMSEKIFVSMVQDLLRSYGPNRIVEIKSKPMTKLANREQRISDWENVCSVVTHTSGLAFEAILRGRVGYCLGTSCTHALIDPHKRGPLDFTPISVEDRTRWACTLANNQWTVEEIQSGLAWEMMHQ